MQTPAAFEYERATSLDGAIASLQRLGPEARVIAGGHSLLPMMKLRLANPEHLIDINDLAELAYIRREGDEIRIGDHLLRIADERQVLGQEGGLQEVDVAGERAHPDLVALPADVGELGEIVDVDQVLGVREPQLHHRQEAVPAGNHARLGAQPLQRRDSAVEARGALILECRRRLQIRAPFRASARACACAAGRCRHAARTARASPSRSPASAAGARGSCGGRPSRAPSPTGWPP